MARKSQNTTRLTGTTPASGPPPRPGHGSAAPHRDSAGGGGRNLPRRKVWGSPGVGPGFPPAAARTNLSPGWVLPRGNSTRPGYCCCAVPSRNAMGTQSLLPRWMPVGQSAPEHPQKGWGNSGSSTGNIQGRVCASIPATRPHSHGASQPEARPLASPTGSSPKLCSPAPRWKPSPRQSYLGSKGKKGPRAALAPRGADGGTGWPGGEDPAPARGDSWPSAAAARSQVPRSHSHSCSRSRRRTCPPRPTQLALLQAVTGAEPGQTGKPKPNRAVQGPRAEGRRRLRQPAPLRCVSY